MGDLRWGERSWREEGWKSTGSREEEEEELYTSPWRLLLREWGKGEVNKAGRDYEGRLSCTHGGSEGGSKEMERRQLGDTQETKDTQFLLDVSRRPDLLEQVPTQPGDSTWVCVCAVTLFPLLTAVFALTGTRVFNGCGPQAAWNFLHDDRLLCKWMQPGESYVA